MTETRSTSTVAGHDPFFAVPTSTTETSIGPIELPFRIYDATNVVAFFAVDRWRVESVLGRTDLIPALTAGGRALVAVSVFEYRSTSVGPYNEVGIGIPVYRSGEAKQLTGWIEPFRRADRRRQGAFIVDLPVTTDAADVAGREIWGYPKFVTSIDVALEQGRFRAEVTDPGGEESIMRLAGKAGLGVPGPGLDFVLYSDLDKTLLRTNVDTRGAYKLHPLGDLRLSVGEAGHPMTERLRQLGLDGSRPVLVLSHQHFQARLNAGVALDATG